MYTVADDESWKDDTWHATHGNPVSSHGNEPDDIKVGEEDIWKNEPPTARIENAETQVRTPLTD